MVFEFFTKMFSSKPVSPSVNPAPAASFAPAGTPNANQFGNIQPSSPVNVGGKRRHKKRRTNKRKHSNRKKTNRRR